MPDISSEHFANGHLCRDDYEEKVIHGNLLFHMSVHMTKIPENSKMILYYHWHEELELFVIQKGCARFQIDNNYYNVQEGEIVFVKPNQLHAAYPINTEEVEFYAILIHSDFISSFVNDSIQQKYIAPFFSPDFIFPSHIDSQIETQLKLLPLLENIVQFYTEEHSGYELLIKSRILEILFRLYTYENQIKPKPIQNETYKIERLKKIIQFIEKNYSYTITLPDLASCVNMSDGHFCRFFKENLKMTPIEYLNNFRISKAVELIETTDNKITEIALDVGFNNINNFTATFKKLLNCTPNKYRQQLSASFKE